MNICMKDDLRRIAEEFLGNQTTIIAEMREAYEKLKNYMNSFRDKALVTDQFLA